uniref:Uncharacterized protein n=1 Tax=viral metagenome TaxID=1070528 RepID=A0A6C0BF63_9ZZZZ
MEIAIALIIKNEEDNIIETIKPWVEYGITSILVYDTGSNDNTIKQLLEYSNIITVIVGKFTTYSESRNKAMELTRLIYPNANFILMPDAEWIPENIDSLIAFCNENIKSKSSVFLVDVVRTIYESYNCNGLIINRKISETCNRYSRLFNSNKVVKFKGVIHEQPSETSFILVPEFKFNWKSTEYGNEKTKKRVVDFDIPHYLKIINENEFSNLNDEYYYLAQSYHYIGDIENAIKYYREVVKRNLKGSFISSYRLGILETDNTEKIEFLKKATILNPKRLEPYILISTLIKDERLVYKITKNACNFKIDNKNNEYIDLSIYKYYRYIRHLRSCLMFKKEDEFDTTFKILNDNNIDGEDVKKEYYEEYVHYLRISMRKTVILILTSAGYEEYNKIMEEYLKRFNIPFFFYMYNNEELEEGQNFKINGHYIYLRGVENIIPGIILKTIQVFRLFLDLGFTDFIRINATTFIDFYSFVPGITFNDDYFGYYISEILIENKEYGVTKEFIENHGSFNFISGKFIYLSRKAVIYFINNADCSVMDDVSIALSLKDKFKYDFKNNIAVYYNEEINFPHPMVICKNPAELQSMCSKFQKFYNFE